MSFQENLQASLEFAQPHILHVDSHGGFAALLSIEIEASAADQTIFSLIGDQGASMMLALNVASSSYMFAVEDNSGGWYYVETSDGSAPMGVQHVLAVQFERHTYSMDVMVIDAGLTVTSIATPASRNAAASAVR